jgi:hypothetical protein
MEDPITLPVTLIYGSNASGKSNLVSALSLTRSLVCGVSCIQASDLAYTEKEMLFSGKVEINGADCFWSVRATPNYVLRDVSPETTAWFRDKLSIFDAAAPTPPISAEMPDLLARLDIDTSRGETDGSRRLRRLLPWIQDALVHGKTLVVDDFDLHMHPVLAEYFVRMFLHNEAGAQLIITTHNTSLMCCGVAREGVWVVEKNRNKESELISLLEYRIPDDSAMRDVEKMYLVCKFEGVPYINSDILDLISEGGKPMAMTIDDMKWFDKQLPFVPISGCDDDDDELALRMSMLTYPPAGQYNIHPYCVVTRQGNLYGVTMYTPHQQWPGQDRGETISLTGAEAVVGYIKDLWAKGSDQ